MTWIQHECPGRYNIISRWLAIWQDRDEYWLFERHFTYLTDRGRGMSLTVRVCKKLVSNGKGRRWSRGSECAFGHWQDFASPEESWATWERIKRDPMSFMMRTRL